MSIRYQELDRNASESMVSYDNRINALSDVLVGYAYFGPNGYNADTNHYGLYVVWNGEINSKLRYSHPEYGYCIKCDLDTAKGLCFKGQGLGVYGKVHSVKGKLSVKSMYISLDDISYELFYLGLSVAKPDNICFFEMNNKKLVPDARDDIKTESCDSENFNLGSFNLGSFNVGSFNIGSFSIGSFNLGSFNLSSFNLGSFNIGSFNLGSFNVSSFSLGSFNVSSFILGSFNASSFSLGSFRQGSFNIGSFDLGSFSPVDFETLDETNHNYHINIAGSEVINISDFYKDVFGIGYLGYGLNLI